MPETRHDITTNFVATHCKRKTKETNLFDGDGASTSQIALKVCTPSVGVAASPALIKQQNSDETD